MASQNVVKPSATTDEPKSPSSSMASTEPETNEHTFQYMSLFLDFAIPLLLPATIILHLCISPYTKVEESFNLQAIHDVVTYGIPWFQKNSSAVLQEQWDHMSFPGAVPRSFLGASVLGMIAQPFLWMIEDGLHRQMFVRAILGLYNAFAMISLAKQIAHTYSKGAARWYVLLQASQFHIMYYASRTLPNMFAFGLSMIYNNLSHLSKILAALTCRAATHALSRFIAFDNVADIKFGIELFVFSGIVFRSELAIYLATMLVPILAKRQIPILNLIMLGAKAACIALAVSVPLDTFLWQTWPRPMWAELMGFWYNTVEGKASDWGTSPPLYYFFNSLPKLILNPMALLVLLPLGAINGKEVASRLVFPALAFIGIYSILPHKEWRFIIYTVPALTAAAGVGANTIFSKRFKSIIYGILSLGLVASVIATYMISTAMLVISSLNYPGGYALSRLDRIAHNELNLTIHLDVLTCMTGASRFTQNNVKHPGWRYTKEESFNTLEDRAFWKTIDYAINEELEQPRGNFDVIAGIDGFDAIGVQHIEEKVRGYILGGDLLMPLWHRLGAVVVIKMHEMLYIMGKASTHVHNEDEHIEEKANHLFTKARDEL